MTNTDYCHLLLWTVIMKMTISCSFFAVCSRESFMPNVYFSGKTFKKQEI